MFYKVGDVVQFNENHKWCGSLGIVEEVKEVKDNYDRYMIGVPIPKRGIAYIFVNERDNVIEYVDKAVLMAKEVEEEDD